MSRALVCVALAACLMAWQVREVSTDPRGYWLYLQDPPRWDGAAAVISIYEVITLDAPDRLVVGRGLSRALVEAPTQERSIGEEITVIGHFRASDRTVVADTVETHPGRPYKKASGYVAFLLSMLLSPLAVRATRAGLVLRG